MRTVYVLAALPYPGTFRSHAKLHSIYIHCVQDAADDVTEWWASCPHETDSCCRRSSRLSRVRCLSRETWRSPWADPGSPGSTLCSSHAPPGWQRPRTPCRSGHIPPGGLLESNKQPFVSTVEIS